MKRQQALELLRWAMPRLSLDWAAHRRVRGQIVKRATRRAAQLGVDDAAGYARLLEQRPEEWEVLRGLCRVTVSRFYRDAEVFERLRTRELPRLAAAARERGAARVRAWSAGCGAGEEAGSVALCWHVGFDGPSLAERFCEVELCVVGTDVDEHQLERARRGAYPEGAFVELPAAALGTLERSGDGYALPDAIRRTCSFQRQDLTRSAPAGRFDLILCRNLAFSYFDPELRRRVVERLASVSRDGAAWVLGRGERLPPAPAGGRETSARRSIVVVAG